MNRLYSLVHPDRVSLPFSYASAVVLPLLGFWNAVIFFTSSREAVKTLFVHAARKASVVTAGSLHVHGEHHTKHRVIEVDRPMTLARDRRSIMQGGNASWDSLRGLAAV